MVLRDLRSRLGIVAVVAACLTAAMPAHAQQVDDTRIQELERRLEQLMQDAASLRGEIDRLKQGAPAEEDLTAVDVVPAAPETPQQQQPAVEDIQPVTNTADPSASKVFNPDISVIGTFFGHAGDVNELEFGEDDARGPIDLGEVEVAFEAFVDPYAKGKFFLAVGHEGIEVEEGYAEFVTLPWDLSAKVGKKKAVFGKANTWHTHIRPWADQPLVLHNFFGDEGLADTGVSVSKIVPNRFVYTEVTAEVFSGGAEGVFERQSQNDLFYNTHLRLFRDLTESSNLELGGSYARGTGAGSGTTSQFGGIDVSYRWKPLQQGLYRGFIGRVEAMVNDRDDLAKRLFGYYASAEWKVAQRWIVGARLDRGDRAHEDDFRFTDRGASLLLTFLPSEFSAVRGQLRRTSYGGAKAVNEVLLELQFAIGAHGAHPF